MRPMRHYIPVIFVLVFSACSQSPESKEAKSLERGKKFLEQHDFSRALLEFKNASQAMPRDAEPYYQAGLAEFEQGNAQKAFDSFKRATQLNPNHEGARLKVAEIMAMSAQPAAGGRSRKRLNAMLPSAPSNPELLDTLAITEAQLGNTADAETHLQQALDKAPGHLNSAIAMAQLKLAQKDVAGAEEVLKRAVQQDPKSAPAALAMARFYLQVNRQDDGLAQLQRAVELDPKSGPALFQFGRDSIQDRTSAGSRADLCPPLRPARKTI